jgi:hypothetical protein
MDLELLIDNEYLKEYPLNSAQSLPFLERSDDGWWRLPGDGDGTIPLVFALRAVKE